VLREVEEKVVGKESVTKENEGEKEVGKDNK